MDEELFEALEEQARAFKRVYGCYPNELRRRWNVKLWFNRMFPYCRLCLHNWCLRFQTYDYRCEKHQND